MNTPVSETMLLCVAIGSVALLYSSVGHGGATGYLAVMALLGISPALAKPSALWMNCFVAGIAFWKFRRAGYFDVRIFLPLAVASVPMAWLGSRLDFHPASASIVLASALAVAGWMLGWGRFGFGRSDGTGARTFLSASSGQDQSPSHRTLRAVDSGEQNGGTACVHMPSELLRPEDRARSESKGARTFLSASSGEPVPVQANVALAAAEATGLDIPRPTPAQGHPGTRAFAVGIGAGLGFLAGLTGIGGGVFLTPLLIFCKWAPAKVAGGISALFILVNSAAGLLGLGAKAWSLDSILIWPAIFGIAGALAGSHLGVRRWSAPVFQKALAVVLWIAAAKLFLTHS